MSVEPSGRRVNISLNASSEHQPARGVLLIAYNRPVALERTIRSLKRAIAELTASQRSEQAPIFVALEGPRNEVSDQTATQEVARIIGENFSDATVIAQEQNRGLPALLVDTLDQIFHDRNIDELICVEDDVELASTALLALFEAATLVRSQRGEGFVIGGAPLHADGSLEHQLLLVTKEAWSAARPLLVDYIQRFSLDGALKERAYGERDHEAIFAWSHAIAVERGLKPPRGTSQDRMRELAWRMRGIPLIGLPIRVVQHRGLWGQHNTPWHALRTGQLFQRLDLRPWSEVRVEIRDSLKV